MNKDVKEFSEEDPRIICSFCHISEVNSLEWGPMYHLDGVSAHYFCMLFSTKIKQNGEDHEGILGHLPKDILKEVKRGDKLECKFCQQPNATIKCSHGKCRTRYHYICGYENNCVFQFIDNYDSFCSKHHEPVQIPLRKTDWVCPICFGDISKEETPLWLPCCNKRAFHRKCIMEMARTHGLHFFKCPLCKNKDEFSVAMRKSGVFVPDRDAAWEMEPDAFAEHRVLHSRCDADECKCPRGREFNDKSENKPWHIVRCGGCSAFAVHKTCGNLQNLSWRCSTCASILFGKDEAEDEPPIQVSSLEEMQTKSEPSPSPNDSGYGSNVEEEDTYSNRNKLLCIPSPKQLSTTETASTQEVPNNPTTIPEIVNLDDESSDSDLEMLEEIVVTSLSSQTKSSTALDLCRRMKDGEHYRNQPPVFFAPAPFAISEVYKCMIQRAKAQGPTCFTPSRRSIPSFPEDLKQVDEFGENKSVKKLKRFN